jgi:hypothetical protein
MALPVRRQSSSDDLPVWVRAGRSASRDCAAPVRWLRLPPGGRAYAHMRPAKRMAVLLVVLRDTLVA